MRAVLISMMQFNLLPVYYRLVMTKLPLPVLSLDNENSVQIENHSYCWVARSAAAGVGISETVAILPFAFDTLFCKRTPDAHL